MRRKIVNASWADRKFPGKENVRKNLEALYPGENPQERLKEYYRKKIKGLGWVLGIGIGLTLLVFFQSQQSKELEENAYLPRKENVYEKKLQLQVEGEETQEISITVEPPELSPEESKELLKTVKNQMPEYILGENPSLDEIRSDLHLMSEIEGLPVSVTWELDSYEVLNLDGVLRQENLKEEGTIVGLTAHLVCNGEVDIYQAYAKILPPVISEKEGFAKELWKELDRLESETKESKQKELPQEIQGKELIWKEKPSWSALAVLGLTFLCVPLLSVSQDQKIKQQGQERKQQMCRDYARIVSKLVLLIGAGMTIRNAWEQIVRDYQNKRKLENIDLRYAYEEMALTCYEMQNGVAEAKAYENFGRRCGIDCYLKLSALLEQNMKKGNRGLTTLLKVEVQDAFIQRKELARIQGEQAATKLLFPMVLLLLVVILLILIPAGLSLQI